MILGDLTQPRRASPTFWDTNVIIWFQTFFGPYLAPSCQVDPSLDCTLRLSPNPLNQDGGYPVSGPARSLSPWFSVFFQLPTTIYSVLVISFLFVPGACRRDIRLGPAEWCLLSLYYVHTYFLFPLHALLPCHRSRIQKGELKLNPNPNQLRWFWVKMVGVWMLRHTCSMVRYLSMFCPCFSKNIRTERVAGNKTGQNNGKEPCELIISISPYVTK